MATKEYMVRLCRKNIRKSSRYLRLFVAYLITDCVLIGIKLAAWPESLHPNLSFIIDVAIVWLAICIPYALCRYLHLIVSLKKVLRFLSRIVD